ncbi:hypothetical protein PIB30_073155 [Stylosanthes scabra]|uniref:Uncharacterized protein n=1 Tax=Stylosanthes scabra TaxID=79078 RepID=A0ABU6VR62_9FABA|nr:hypothetical protein [Stylosanthes scabra]
MDVSEEVMPMSHSLNAGNSQDPPQTLDDGSLGVNASVEANMNVLLSMEAAPDPKCIITSAPEEERTMFMTPEEEYIESTKEKVDLDTRLNNIEQNMAMADYRACRTEIIALDVKHEVRQLKEEVRALRAKGAAFWRGQGATLNRDTLERDVNCSVQLSGAYGSTLGKGKEPLSNPVDVGGLFDMVAPTSPSDDDVVFIGEHKTNPHMASQHTMFHPIASNDPSLPLGLPEFDLGFNGMMTSGTPTPAATTKMCGLYASQGAPGRAPKVPKVENIEYSTMFNSPLHTLGGVGMAPSATPAAQRCIDSRAALNPLRKTRKRKTPSKPQPCNVIPETHKLLIRPTPDMGLTKEECSLAAYVFSTSHEYSPKELLFQYKTITVRRDILSTLYPDVVPHSDVVNSAALVSSLHAGNSKEVACWFFPYTFSHEILEGKSAAELIGIYTGGGCVQRPRYIMYGH